MTGCAKAKALVPIHAPVGSGTSTLAAEWVSVLGIEGVRVEWLKLDHDDHG